MMKQNKPLLLLATIALLVAAALLLFPRPAAAQCGSSASSCKNCHEVQGKDPVNAKGVWHTAHAFGDFCEFCHGGNVKSKDEAGAHTGLVAPLADVKASCQSCHPNDYMDRAKKYSDALGKPIGSGTTTGAASPNASGTLTTTTAATTLPCGPAAPSSGQVIDLNAVYAQTGAPPPTNWGNWILVGMIGATLLGLLALVWHYDQPLPKVVAAARALLATPLVAATPEGFTMPVPAEITRQPELAVLERALAKSDVATLRAVTRLLADRENGPRVLKALSNLDLNQLATLGESDQRALTALLALAKELNA